MCGMGQVRVSFHSLSCPGKANDAAPESALPFPCYGSTTGSFTVSSDTAILNLPGASRFLTSLSLTALERRLALAENSTSSNTMPVITASTALTDPEQGTADEGQKEDDVYCCDIVFTVRVSAGLPW